MTLVEFGVTIQGTISHFLEDTLEEHESDPEGFPLEREPMDWWAEAFAYALMHAARALIAEGKDAKAQELLARYGIALPELKADDEPLQSEPKGD